MIIIGIDPGVSGGISILENKKVIEVFDMPTMIDGKKNKRQVNGSQVTNIIKENIQRNKDLFKRNITYKRVELDNTFPKHILENKEELRSWIV